MDQRETALQAWRRELERLVRRLASVDDGIVTVTRRELVGRIREALAALGAAARASLGPEVDHGPGDRRLLATCDRLVDDLDSALSVVDDTSPRAPEWEVAARRVRERLAALVDAGLEPVAARAERRFGRPFVDHVAREAREQEAATAPLPKAA